MIPKLKTSRENYYKLYTQYSIGNGLMLIGAFLTGKVSYWFVVILLLGGWFRGQAFLMMVEAIIESSDEKESFRGR